MQDGPNPEQESDWLDAPEREIQGVGVPDLAHDFHVEQDLLGGLLFRPEQLDRLAALKPAHMSMRMHGRLLELMREARGRGELFSITTLYQPLEDEFKADFDGASLTSRQYLTKMAMACLDNRPEYQATLARRLIDLWAQRQLQMLGPEAASMVAGDLSSTLGKLEADIQAIRKDQAALVGRDCSVGAALDEAMAEIEAAYQNRGIIGLRTGYHALDHCLGGIEPTDLCILAGRTSMGKTSMARGVLRNTAKAGGRVLMFSLEMSRAQLAKALVSMETGIAGYRLRTGQVSAAEFNRAIETERRIRELPIFIDDRSGTSVGDIRATAERHMEDAPLALIIVDYLQIVGTPERRRGSNRAEEVGEITTGLKGIAKQLKVPVMALAQLSRETEKQEDKRPSLANLKESGSIEEAADSVILLHREEYYLARSEPDRKDIDKWGKWRTKMDAAEGKADAIVAKNRHGPADTCKLAWHGATMMFGNLDEPGGDQGGML